MHYSSVIFDLDGTLLDTLEDLADAGNKVLMQSGYPTHPVEAYKYFVGDGLQALIEKITPESATHADVSTCFDLFKTVYAQGWRIKTSLYPGVEDLLNGLRKAGLNVAVLSNKPHDFTLLCVDHFFPRVSFQSVYGQREGVPKKPDPAGALHIAAELGVEPESCVYVGDTKIDMHTGKSAGMFTIGVLWGFRTADELREHGADILVQHPTELLDVIWNLQQD
ncbi:MAG: HAD family hydrolase [Desulfopila sp.]|jgi:phosphoglycolate phosphatase|nr:HAD family hydrolase [Desulfopila sp.]